MARINQQTGDAIPLVNYTHNSNDYIAFLKMPDDMYPKRDKIRLIPDNLRVHSSQKVIEYPETCPNRFEFVFILRHASWSNLVESFFSEMTKQVLLGIRADSKEKLKERIYRYFDKINAAPAVVYHWRMELTGCSSKRRCQSSNANIVNI